MCSIVLVFASLDFDVSCSEDDLNVARVTLVWVNATVGTVCATTGFRSLLHDDALDEEIFDINVFGIRI